MEVLRSKLSSGKTAWIQEVSKELLLQLVEELKLPTGSNPSVEELRKLLREYVKSVEEKSGKMAAKQQALLLPSSLENFNGGNWCSYMEQLNCYMLLHDIPDTKKVPLLLTKLSSTVYDNLSGLCSPVSPLKYDYEDLCNKLEEYYHPKINTAMNRAKFKDRNQEETESIKDYLLALRKMTKDCQFKEVDEHLKLLNGVNSETIRYELLKIADKPLKELSSVAETAEMAFKLSHKEDSKAVEMFKLKSQNFKSNKWQSKAKNMNDQQNRLRRFSLVTIDF